MLRTSLLLKAAGHDLAHPLLPSLSPPNPSPSQTKRDFGSLSQKVRRTHFPRERGQSAEIQPPDSLHLPSPASEGHCSCSIFPSEAPQPTGSQRPGDLKKGGSGLVSRTEQQLGFFFFLKKKTTILSRLTGKKKKKKKIEVTLPSHPCPPVI